ncbi:MAG: AAA family ATPase [Desulfatibacillaceae bacterium]
MKERTQSENARRTETDQDGALRLLEESDRCMFVTGLAGTGKSTLLARFMVQTGKAAAVVAPTGIAALAVGGETLHSFFRLPPRALAADEVPFVADPSLYGHIGALVVDEISMVRADMMQAVDNVLKKYGPEPGAPFGGVQVIVFGDLFQLPPVVSTREERHYLHARFGGPFFFNADCTRRHPFELVELNHIYRQTDPGFIELLNAVRDGGITEEQLSRLNDRVASGEAEIEAHDAVLVTPTNKRAEAVNNARLAALAGEERTYECRTKGDFDLKAAPAPRSLTLKEAARVMFLRNDPDGRWVNGTLGVVSSLGREGVEVVVRHQGAEYEVEVFPEEWENLKYRYDPGAREIAAEKTGSYSQLPLKPAYAVTIHKSQGQTLERVVVDMAGGAFAHGQTYVALSRCTSLEGLLLARPLRMRDVIVDPAVMAYVRGGGLRKAATPDRPATSAGRKPCGTPKDHSLPHAPRAATSRKPSVAKPPGDDDVASGIAPSPKTTPKPPSAGRTDSGERIADGRELARKVGKWARIFHRALHEGKMIELDYLGDDGLLYRNVVVRPVEIVGAGIDLRLVGRMEERGEQASLPVSAVQRARAVREERAGRRPGVVEDPTESRRLEELREEYVAAKTAQDVQRRLDALERLVAHGGGEVYVRAMRQLEAMVRGWELALARKPRGRSHREKCLLELESIVEADSGEYGRRARARMERLRKDDSSGG